MLAQIRKTIAEIFVFVDFHLYYTEPDSSHGSLFKGWGLFVSKQLNGGGLVEDFSGRRGFNRVFTVWFQSCSFRICEGALNSTIPLFSFSSLFQKSKTVLEVNQRSVSLHSAQTYFTALQ